MNQPNTQRLNGAPYIPAMGRYLVGLTLLTGACCVGTAQAQVRFSYSTDGSEVTDSKTELIWQRCSVGQSWSWSGSTCTGTAATFTHEAALGYAQTQTGGWRLPNVKELSSLIDRTVFQPTIDRVVFPATPAGMYWSASPYAVDKTASAWSVIFGNGHVSNEIRSSAGLVRLVRNSSTAGSTGTVTGGATTGGTSTGGTTTTGGVVAVGVYTVYAPDLTISTVNASTTTNGNSVTKSIPLTSSLTATFATTDNFANVTWGGAASGGSLLGSGDLALACRGSTAQSGYALVSANLTPVTNLTQAAGKTFVEKSCATGAALNTITIKADGSSTNSGFGGYANAAQTSAFFSKAGLTGPNGGNYRGTMYSMSSGATTEYGFVLQTNEASTAGQIFVSVWYQQ